MTESETSCWCGHMYLEHCTMCPDRHCKVKDCGCMSFAEVIGR